MNELPLPKARFSLRDVLVFCLGLSVGIVLGMGSTRWRASPAYNLVPFDVVIVRGMSDLPNTPAQETYAVTPEGKIDLGPIYGRVAVAGMTLDQAEAAVQEAVKAKVRQAELTLSLVSTVEQ